MLGSSFGWPIAANAQSSSAPPNFNFEIQSLRANAPQFHPNRGEVDIDDLESMEAKRPQLPLNRYLSIFVSDVDTMNQIKFSEVMDQLVKQSGDPFLTKQILFHQWWDSAGQGPGLGLGPHCDDESPPMPPGGIADDTAVSMLNKFKYRCPRLERAEAASDPFTDESKKDANGNDVNKNAYSAIAFSNRFDLISAPKRIGNTGRTESPDCGEYRIVFARNSGKLDAVNRNLIIFEARVPNPEPPAGPKGCREIVEFWHSLSDPSMTAAERGKKLHDFYLKGLPGEHVAAVVKIGNYTFGSGQIRTNQFMLNSENSAPGGPHPKDWTLREFKALAKNGTLVIVPDSVKTNPGNPLFAAGETDPRVGSLNQTIRPQMKKILGGGASAGVEDVNAIAFFTPGKGINSFESDEKEPDLGDIVAKYAPGGAENPQLKTNIQETLNLAGSTLTPLNVINRIRTQTCAGCHVFSDNDDQLGGKAIWPDKTNGKTDGVMTHQPMRFTQESELNIDLQDAIADRKPKMRYAISSAVECFLDFREAFMKKALGLAPGIAAKHCPTKKS